MRERNARRLPGKLSLIWGNTLGLKRLCRLQASGVVPCQWDDGEHILGLRASGIPRITLDTGKLTTM
ncbi:hypothetical protein [Desulfitobacterium dichloroeliminans]|uniref:hypothetical protein n=1 Tax=Desulfitobacterium dichloroeliminans TaxID=233055 RepID=UPI0012EAB999|nr:hypothetical protein [Desulfitobacterium dichloroeliminans]